MGEEEIAEVMEVMSSGHLSRYGDLNDPGFKHKVMTFEEDFARYIGVRHCQATSSGTSALLISMKAIGVEPGDEVIIPTFGFVASYGATIFLGAIPVLAEIDCSLTIDIEDLEQRVTPKTKAIMPIHMMGNPCRIDQVLEVAERYELGIVEDCCQACGASFKGRKVGSFGKIAAFSLNVFKTITTGDGGMLVTDSEELYQSAFAMQDQGYRRKDGKLEIVEPSVLGLNFRVNELTGAVALAQLRKLDWIIETLRRKKAALRSRIAEAEGIDFRRINDPEGECGTLLTVIFESAERAALVADFLGTVTLDRSGWHVYSNMDHVNRHLKELGRPSGLGAYPKTDDLLRRSINLSVGVVDAGLGSAFGINIQSTAEEIDLVADRFLTACRKFR
jgi:dTDP-4-amino-4,6-dideoxygalactose transaminase